MVEYENSLLVGFLAIVFSFIFISCFVIGTKLFGKVPSIVPVYLFIVFVEFNVIDWYFNRRVKVRI